MSEPILLISTCGAGEAERLAAALVEERLAACVNLVPGVRSVYRWQGAVHKDDEVLLLIKTTDARMAQVRARLRDLHSYEVPELIRCEITGGDVDYLSWLERQVATENVGEKGRETG